jgi:tetratricopeptide (TPR) repeat protein
MNILRLPGAALVRFWPLALALAWFPFGSTQGQTASSPGLTGLELTPAVQLTLKNVSDKSVEWHQAFQAGDRARTEALTQELLANAQALGLERLPDISAAALVRAVQVAGDGDLTRASWALDEAERMDPERPETSFARARIHRLGGAYLKALGQDFAGVGRMLRLPAERTLWFHNLILWLLYTLLVGGGLYIAVLIGVRGRWMIDGLEKVLGRILPRPVVLGLMAVLLVGPLLLPYGLLWFLLIWSVLLWGYGSISERVTLAVLWLFMGVVPFVLVQERQQIAVELSPPMRALNNIEQARLYGSLFTDLAVLRAVLPDSPALDHLVADLHRRLGQWQMARSIYMQLADAEPGNAAVQIDLGIYYFNRDDFGRAQHYFQTASVSDPSSAVAYFNLSQAYNASYHFDDASQALAIAQQLDSNSVTRWIAAGDQQQVRSENGGIDRIPELKSQLFASSLAAPGRDPSNVEWLRRGLSILVALGLFLVAGAVHLARRGASRPESPQDMDTDNSISDLLLRVVVPGLKSARVGNGPLAYLATLPIVGLVLIPLASRWGIRIPWGYDPRGTTGFEIALIGLVLILVLRLLRHRRVD